MLYEVAKASEVEKKGRIVRIWVKEVSLVEVVQLGVVPQPGWKHRHRMLWRTPIIFLTPVYFLSNLLLLQQKGDDFRVSIIYQMMANCSE